MWPFKRKPLPPAPAPAPLSRQMAVVYRIANAFGERSDLIDYIRSAQPAVLVCYLEKVGSATGDVEIRSDGTVAVDWREWIEYDPYEKKRSQLEANRDNTGNYGMAPITTTITMPTSIVEQHTRSVVLPGENEDVVVLPPLRVVDAAVA